jgi:hypothetical protein
MPAEPAVRMVLDRVLGQEHPRRDLPRVTTSRQLGQQLGFARSDFFLQRDP